MSSSERMREAMKNNAESNINPASAIQQKVKQDIEERKMLCTVKLSLLKY